MRRLELRAYWFRLPNTALGVEWFNAGPAWCFRVSLVLLKVQLYIYPRRRPVPPANAPDPADFARQLAATRAALRAGTHTAVSPTPSKEPDAEA